MLQYYYRCTVFVLKLVIEPKAYTYLVNVTIHFLSEYFPITWRINPKIIILCVFASLQKYHLNNNTLMNFFFRIVDQFQANQKDAR